MKRYFSTTGVCVPEDHYMVPPFRGLDDDIMRLIETKQYFLIHAPARPARRPFCMPSPSGSTGRGNIARW
ncbi:MAG: hypothetical protein NW241_01925 [Bacteroidia bacterium]|nr:hypothetical protein [Bacteroidia bacterium]